MGSSGPPGGGAWPKILLAKPAAHPSGGGAGASGVPSGVVKLMRDEESAARSRLYQGSLNLITDAWEFSADRLLPLMSDNTDFTVVGVLGLPGVGKSTILNELYGFDSVASGVLPPFPVQTEETRAQARHCSTGMELRVSSERLILLDTQPIYSSSVLMDLTLPDGSSSLQLLSGESISGELAYELMGLQLGVFLTAVCHVVLLVTDGKNDTTLWKMLQTIEMLRQGIPDPSTVGSGGQLSTSTEDIPQETNSEFFADTIFVHTKLRESDLDFNSIEKFKAALSEYFKSSFRRNGLPQTEATENTDNALRMETTNVFVLPRAQDESSKKFKSSSLMLRQLRDQILSMPRRSFPKPLNERDWLRNASRVWDLVKKSPVISDYGKLLQNSGLFRR
ncbi:hypothetical protein SELMODRAFT_114916 [Selaginella moellendorffii]|uniref:Protein SMG9 n=1 Tax=Selaginella moellendorffii TaxID=88036 RepID=D8SEK5_SELML|nr:protein SMG9 [Selaginella moellendorffii]EFJ17128.1 hypothetical protein SELMODRAFT_114916 [Selaginella moellendorffii]|eukprot:XP_002981646.1 protein SMG9 [Selaginella moellendorffii]